MVLINHQIHEGLIRLREGMKYEWRSIYPFNRKRRAYGGSW